MGEMGGRSILRLASHSSAASMCWKFKNAPIEKAPLTRNRVTQLSYPITRTDPELSTLIFLTSCLP